MKVPWDQITIGKRNERKLEREREKKKGKLEIEFVCSS